MLPLPKVAYVTSRVVTSFGQSPTIRNALHLQSSPSSSKSSSPGSNYFQQNKGSSKPLYNFFDQASGGSKGSRFTHGYLGVSRVVTQVQPIIANDTGHVQSDDYEEVIASKPLNPLQHKPRRYRSHSLSYTQERTQRLNVLSTVQSHARSKHAFSQTIITDEIVADSLDPAPYAPPLVRRNSTASITRSDDPPIDTLSPPFSASDLLPHIADAIDIPPSNVTSILSPSHTSPHSEHYRAFINARSSGDHEVALLAVNNFRAAFVAKSVEPSVYEFNAALEALYHTRPQGSPLTDIQDLYNTMISLGVQPDVRTYTTLIYAHCDRDCEVVWALTGIEHKSKSQRILNPSTEHSLSPEDIARKEALEKEGNFSSAVSLFQTLRTLPLKEHLQIGLFSSLLSCCAHYGAVDVAIMVWECIERHPLQPSAVLYKSMIQAFAQAGELNAAEDVFADFREKSAAGKIAWGSDKKGYQVSALRTWNVMIEAYFKCGKPDMAIGLLQEMLDARQSSGQTFELPSPAPSTYTTIITGFCNSGDYQSAMTWFNTLIAQSSSPGFSFDPSLSPSRPDTLAYRALLETLSRQSDETPALNTVWSQLLKFAAQDGIDIRLIDRCLVAQANLAAIQSILISANGNVLSEESLKQCFDHLEVAKSTVILESPISTYVAGIWEAYFNLGLPIQAMDFALQLFNQQNSITPLFRSQLSKFAQLAVAQDWRKITTGPASSLGYAFTLIDLMRRSGLKIHPRFHLYLMQQYYYAREQSASTDNLLPSQIKALCVAAATLEMVEPRYRPSFGGLVPLMEDLVQQKCDISLSLGEHDVRQHIFSALMYDRSVYQVKALIEEFGLVSVFKSHLDAIEPASVTSSPSTDPSNSISTDGHSEAGPGTPLTEPSSSSDDISHSPPQKSLYDLESVGIPNSLHIDRDVTRKADRILLASPDVIWDFLMQNLARGKVPAPYTLSRICQIFGRAKDIEKVKVIYNVAQTILSVMGYNKQLQSDAWFLFEDGMIIALAQAGEVDAAHVHRRRILEQGGAPSADAYGGLILNVKDTTDDTSNAMALFNESQTLRVIPNHYLYNNIISKLAKARKADAALELFTSMKASGTTPSSITYGAVIGACARVGDAASAEALYAEMVQVANFKPRIPPFNTMMQLYTTTKPDRDRALFFYHEISKYGVHPTSYTYKLLMEAYALEPLDIPRMEAVFQELANNYKIELQGTHFATLINAYGCVAKDLDKALASYNSVFHHPRKPVVDALVFEAIANVCVTHRRIDLMPQLVAKMSDVGVHMTAYIVNVMIKGFAAIDDIKRARELFESLVDPPEGVAALHNHAPHEPSKMPFVNPTEPVYREPSTWEAMVRAELGSGTRECAVALIERLETRKYPEAVVNRIRGIIVDHSQLL